MDESTLNAMVVGQETEEYLNGKKTCVLKVPGGWIFTLNVSCYDATGDYHEMVTSTFVPQPGE